MDEPDKLPIVRANNPLHLLQSAIDKGMDPDKLGRLMELAEQWNRDRAAEAFAAAVTAFQSQCPTVLKSRKSVGEKIKFDYASYDDVMRQAGPVLARCGIAVTYTTEPAEQGVQITCRIRVGTHYEETRLTLPIPRGVVNDTQLYGQAVSYAKRYALCAALNIVVTDEDNDAAGCLETITREEMEQLGAAMDEKGMPLAAFLKFAQAADLNSIPRKEFPRLLNAIKNTKPKARTT